ncbi:probable isoaspartyl peptidase/L-asparaginase 3 isoform X3 [Physcomitrium patens]|uniref:probable isoaspartyl peptidase/L-asparaginase 3 isoform X3 n=1 Tax=Physcomitrium patens TaxID=3218 RepID=UPI003CCD6C3C
MIGFRLFTQPELPIVISTWAFVDAVRAAAQHVIKEGGSAVNAVVRGCTVCEVLQCDGSVGYGGSPDEAGETTLDAMVMDGVCCASMDVGAVGALRSVKRAIETARLVMEHTEHTLLVGSQASAFSLSLGLPGPTNLSTDDSLQAWSQWEKGGCQPNFWRDVIPDSTSACGPYKVSALMSGQGDRSRVGGGISGKHRKSSFSKATGYGNHDTISMAVIDRNGRIAAGTSTNGASHKIPGRVGDGAIVGASAYADDDVGACGATGDGDVMMRFLPCYQVVESMRQGMTPEEAAKDSIARIRRKFPAFIGAVFAMNKYGVHAGACHGWIFQYTVQDSAMADAVVFTVKPDVL